MRRRPGAVALASYVVVTLLIERHAVAHLSSVCACNGGSDPTQFMWALAWWPHALLHGVNPFFTRSVWFSHGLDVASVTSVPLAALVATPVTELFGSVVAFNLLTLAAPVLAAWSAYRLCLYVTKAPGASILGGYLYGFSSYELAHMIGLLHTEFTFVPPIVVLLTLKRLDGAIAARRYALLMALMLVVQLGLSTEILWTMSCMGGVALAAAWVFGSAEQRSRIAGLLGPLGAAYAAMLLICSPYLYWEVIRGTAYSKGRATGFNADALGFVIPTEITRLGGNRFATVSRLFPNHNLTEAGSYLGWPLLVIVAAYMVRWWRTLAAKVLLTALIVAAVWTLGITLVLAGRYTISLPFKLLDRVPLFDQLAPARVAVFVALACAVIASLWISSSPVRPAWRWSLAALSVLFLIPNTGARYGRGSHVFYERVPQPRFFTSSLYRRYLSPGEVVMPLPWGRSGLSLLWQADTGMYFRLASGYFEPPPAGYASATTKRELMVNTPLASAGADVRNFIVTHRVSALLVDPVSGNVWFSALSALGLRPVPVGGVLLYRVPASWRT